MIVPVMQQVFFLVALILTFVRSQLKFSKVLAQPPHYLCAHLQCAGIVFALENTLIHGTKFTDVY